MLQRPQAPAAPAASSPPNIASSGDCASGPVTGKDPVSPGNVEVSSFTSFTFENSFNTTMPPQLQVEMKAIAAQAVQAAFDEQHLTQMVDECFKRKLQEIRASQDELSVRIDGFARKSKEEGHDQHIAFMKALSQRMKREDVISDIASAVQGLERQFQAAHGSTAEILRTLAGESEALCARTQSLDQRLARSEEVLGSSLLQDGASQPSLVLSANGVSGDRIGEIMHRTDLLLRRSAQQEEEMSRLAGLVGTGGSSAPSQFNAIAERIDCIATALAHLDGGVQDALDRERQNREVLDKALTMRLAQEVAERTQMISWVVKKLEGKGANVEEFEQPAKGSPAPQNLASVPLGVPPMAALARSGSPTPVVIRTAGFASPFNSARKQQSPLTQGAVRRESGTMPPTLVLPGVSESSAGTPQWSPRHYGDRGAHMPASIAVCGQHSPRLSGRELGTSKVVRMVSQPQSGQSHLVGMPSQQQQQCAVVLTAAGSQTGPTVVTACNSIGTLPRTFSTPYDSGLAAPFSPQVRQRAVRLSTVPGSPSHTGPR